MKVSISNSHEEKGTPGVYYFRCPGCKSYHYLPTEVAIYANGYVWQFNGNLVSPTFRASYNSATGNKIKGNEALTVNGEPWGEICHGVITDGFIEFQSDCTHPFVGQTIEMLNVEL